MPILILIGIALMAMVGGGIAIAASEPVSVGDAVPDTTTDGFTRWDSLFDKYGRIYGVPFMWLKAICMNESSLGTEESVALGIASPGNITDSVSQDGLSWGLMQVTLTTARDFDPAATSVLLNNPDYSVRLAAQKLARSQRTFPSVDERFEQMCIMAYNAGDGRINQWISDTVPEGKEGAVDNALTYWDRYKRNKQAILNAQPERANT